jgi:phosphonate transport system substrate-binding protein
MLAMMAAALRPLRIGASRNAGGGPGALVQYGVAFLEALGRALQTQVEGVIIDDYEALLSAVVAGEVDLAWMSPLLQPRSIARGAHVAVVAERNGWLTHRSAVIVRRDDPRRAASDLRGVRAAWLDPDSASGYLFPRGELLEHGATFAHEQFYWDPVNVAAAVLSGEADVGACYLADPTIASPTAAGAGLAEVLGTHAQGLRALHVTDQIPPAGIVLAPRVTKEEAQLITAGLGALHKDPPGRDVLRLLCHADRLAPVTETLSETLRAWAETVVLRLASARAGGGAS